MVNITSCRNVISIEHTAGAVFVVFLPVLPFRERRNFSLKHVIVLYLQIFNAHNYFLFKISAWGVFLKYSYNFANFSRDIVIKYMLIKKKECNSAQKLVYDRSISCGFPLIKRGQVQSIDTGSCHKSV